MRIGRRLGLDPGSVRIGVAVSDQDGILASPREPIQATDESGLDLLIAEVNPIEIIVGLPRSMDGSLRGCPSF